MSHILKAKESLQVYFMLAFLYIVGWCCATWQRPAYRDKASKWSRWSTCEQNWECSENHTSANRWDL